VSEGGSFLGLVARGDERGGRSLGDGVKSFIAALVLLAVAPAQQQNSNPLVALDSGGTNRRVITSPGMRCRTLLQSTGYFNWNARKLVQHRQHLGGSDGYFVTASRFAWTKPELRLSVPRGCCDRWLSGCARQYLITGSPLFPVSGATSVPGAQPSDNLGKFSGSLENTFAKKDFNGY
jgi:hypothetical protein